MEKVIYVRLKLNFNGKIIMVAPGDILIIEGIERRIRFYIEDKGAYTSSYHFCYVRKRKNSYCTPEY